MGVKIVDDLLARVNELGIKKDVEFFYSLKSKYPTSYIKKDGITKQISLLGYSKATFYRHLKSCIKLGFIKEYSHGYRLISYNKFFDLLRIPVSYSNRVSKVKDVSEVMYYAFVRGIESNLRKQEATVKEKSKDRNSTVQNRPGTIGLDEMKSLISKSEFLHAQGKENTIVNKDVTLSIKGISRTLCMSVGMAHKTLKIVEQMGLIDVIKRSEFVDTFFGSFKDFRDKFKSSRYQLSEGIVTYALPSLIIPTLNNKTYSSSTFIPSMS